MDIKPILPGEISCRNCKRFNYTNSCWEHIKNEPACKKFLSKEGAKNTEYPMAIYNDALKMMEQYMSPEAVKKAKKKAAKILRKMNHRENKGVGR